MNSSTEPAAICRFEVPVDGEWHEIGGCGTPLHVGCRDPQVVEFWAWRRDDLPSRPFRVFGAGHPIPGQAQVQYRGTAVAPGGMLVWHLLEAR